MAKKPHLYLVRGLPGSGKSTFAQELAARFDGKHFEADMFLMEDGVYTYDPAKLEKAHEECFMSTVEALVDDFDIVVVSNTFVEPWMLRRYVDFCKANDIPFTIIKMERQFDNIHNVPARKMLELKQRWVHWLEGL